MKQRASILFLCIVIGWCGCGGGVDSLTPAPVPLNPPPPPTPKSFSISGNWELTTKSTAGGPALTISGNFDAPGSSVSGTVHVSGSNCFDPMAPVGITGTLAGSKLVLTSAGVDSQVISVDSNVTNSIGYGTNLTGTYTIEGGCADGDQGKVVGMNLVSMGGNWGGLLTTAAGDNINISVSFTQEAASPEGSFGLTGTVSLDGDCFKSGTITSGIFPTASYILGTAVSLRVETDNGVIVFPGKWESDGLVRGDYSIVGGICESTGTAYLSPWEY